MRMCYLLKCCMSVCAYTDECVWIHPLTYHICIQIKICVSVLCFIILSWIVFVSLGPSGLSVGPWLGASRVAGRPPSRRCSRSWRTTACPPPTSRRRWPPAASTATGTPPPACWPPVCPRAARVGVRLPGASLSGKPLPPNVGGTGTRRWCRSRAHAGRGIGDGLGSGFHCGLELWQSTFLFRDCLVFNHLSTAGGRTLLTLSLLSEKGGSHQPLEGGGTHSSLTPPPYHPRLTHLPPDVVFQVRN